MHALYGNKKESRALGNAQKAEVTANIDMNQLSSDLIGAKRIKILREKHNDHRKPLAKMSNNGSLSLATNISVRQLDILLIRISNQVTRIQEVSSLSIHIHSDLYFVSASKTQSKVYRSALACTILYV